MEISGQQSDIELIKRCVLHDEDAFTELYNRYRLQLFSYLHRLLPGNNSVVDDIFQLVWIKVNRNLPGYRDEQKFLAWICRIAHNLVIDYFRRNPGTEMTELTSAIPANTPGVDKQLDDAALEEALELALVQLNDSQREVVEMRRAGIPFKDIALHQNTNLNTVLGRMHSAVKKLQIILKDRL